MFNGLRQSETFRCLHDLFNDSFSHGLAPLEIVNAFDYLGISFLLVLKILGLGIINIVLFGESVKTIDPRGSHELIAFSI